MGQHTISSYLIEKLKDFGVRHVFGVPGDYVLGFYKELENSSLALKRLTATLKKHVK